MGADVGNQRPDSPGTTDVDAGAGVRGLPWTRTAIITNWLLGSGSQLIPACAPNITLASGKTHELYFRVRPRYQAFQRIWGFTLRTATGGDVTCSVAAPTGGTAVVYPVAENQETATLLTLVEDLSSQSDTEGNASIQFTPTADTVLVSLSCFEVPRAELTTGTSDDGVDSTKFGTSFPIRAEDYTNMIDVLTDETKIGRRASLWQWAVPHNVNSALTAGFAWKTAASSYQSMFPLGAPVLARKLAPTATTASVTCRLTAWVDTGTTGNIYFTSAVNGNSNSATVTTTTPAWSTTLTLDVDCEDLASTDGRQTAATPAWDLIGVYAKTTTASTGSIYISAVSVWED